MLERERKRLSTLPATCFAAKREMPGIVLVGDPTQRLPNTLNVLFPDVSGRKVLEACPRVMASTGSACHADSEEPSAILTALGISRDEALGAVRLSLGRGTTKEDPRMRRPISPRHGDPSCDARGCGGMRTSRSVQTKFSRKAP